MKAQTARALAVFLVCAAAPAWGATRHVALVIGNAMYAELPPLGTCSSSAHVVAAALRRAGFEVTERTDLTNGQMGAAIGDFADLAARAPDSVAAAYVCGYAVDFRGRIFLLPASAHLQADTDVLTQGVSGATFVNSVLRAAPSGLVLLDTMGLQGHGPLKLDALVDGGSLGAHGFAATQALGPTPNGPTDLAAAVAEGLSANTIELRGFLQALRARLPASSRLASATAEPAQPVLLRGEPPPPAAPLPDDWRGVQAALQKLGYYDGKVDGVAGAETLAAVRRYQHELHAEMTGRLTSDQAKNLLTRQ